MRRAIMCVRPERLRGPRAQKQARTQGFPLAVFVRAGWWQRRVGCSAKQFCNGRKRTLWMPTS
jgi:hypothetical protein